MLIPAVHPGIVTVRRVPLLLIPSLSDCLFLAILLWVSAAGSGWSVLLADGDTGFRDLVTAAQPLAVGTMIRREGLKITKIPVDPVPPRRFFQSGGSD